MFIFGVWNGTPEVKIKLWYYYGSLLPASVTEIFVRVFDTCVYDTDKNVVRLPVVSELGEPVEVVVGCDSVVLEFFEYVPRMNVNDNQCTECNALLLGKRPAHLGQLCQ